MERGLLKIERWETREAYRFRDGVGKAIPAHFLPALIPFGCIVWAVFDPEEHNDDE
jgi:hypothetical protein